MDWEIEREGGRSRWFNVGFTIFGACGTEKAEAEGKADACFIWL